MYGVLPSGKDVIPKIMWVRDKEPEIFKKAYKIIDCGSYVVHKFTGEFKMDFSCASVTGLLDNKKKTWSKMFSGVLGLPVEKFCTAVKSTELVGGVTKETALETGLKEGTPVFCGCGDAAASAVGSGAVRANHANIYIGTSGWVEVTVDKPVVIKKGGIATICAADQGKWLLIAETESAGACLKWFGDVLGGEERAEAEKSGESIYRVFDRIAEGVEPGSKSLIFTPWMFGERAPICDENVRGGFINLSLDHRREHMIRAIMEGVAYHNAWMLEAIENKIGIESMNATGGGARSKVWLQMIADVTGKTVKQTASPLDGCSIGAALTAAVGLGIYRDFDSLEGVIPMAGEFHPREENRMKYAVLYENFKKVYEGLAGLYCSLNKCE
jgi:xylulokinase